MTVSSLANGSIAATCALALLAGNCGSTAQKSPLTIAAASDLNFALDEVVAHYPSQVRITYGSSGNFVAQIQNGAPFDIFLSADLEYARRLAPRPDAVFPY